MYNRSGSSYCCVRCDESFRLEKAERKNAAKCKVPNSSSLFLDRAVLCARRCMDDHTISVHTKASENETLKNMVVDGTARNSVTFPPFWTVLPVSGIHLGANLVDPFKRDIEKMVDDGNADKLKKLRSSQIQEKMSLWYPNKMDIPNTYHINSCVTSYRGEAGNDKDDDDEEEGKGDGTRKALCRMPVR